MQACYLRLNDSYRLSTRTRSLLLYLSMASMARGDLLLSTMNVHLQLMRI
jgi:hypothetical protein